MKFICNGIVVKKNEDSGVPIGWKVRIEKDVPYGHFYIFLENPNGKGGFDEWYENETSLKQGILDWGDQIAWERPIETLVEEEKK